MVWGSSGILLFPGESIAHQAFLALKPEKINTYELSYQAVLKNSIHSQLSLFLNQMADLIEFKSVDTFPTDALFPGSSGGTIPSAVSFVNRGKARAIGGEAAVRFHAMRWLNGFVNYSYQRLMDVRTDQRIRSAPQHKLSGGLRFKLKNDITANIIAHYVSPTEWDNVKVDAYTLVNARMGYSMMGGHTEITLSAFNLFNNKHREHPLGDEIGRRITAGLTYSF